jgi:tRNA A37 methylthiotransferase MiaB
LCDKYGIFAHCLTIIGFPWEDEESIRQTYEFVAGLKFDRLRVTMATPFRGTELYEQACKEGLFLTEDPDRYDTLEPVIKCGMSSAKLVEWKEKMQALHYTNRYFTRVLDKIRRRPALVNAYANWYAALADRFQL